MKIEGLCKSYGAEPAVDDFSLQVRPREIYGLLGPDGAGKSTVMKILAGVLRYDSGLVEVFGTSLARDRDAERIKGRIGFMPQGLGLNLYPELSVEENIDFFGNLRLVPKNQLKSRKERLLKVTRLDTFRDRPMKNLSGGMKQKLGLVCTLIHQPELVILDEPTTGVDPVSRRDFWVILGDLMRERDMVVLASTAYLEEASRFHCVSLINQGRVLAQGRPEELQKRLPGLLVSARILPQAPALTKLREVAAQVEARGSRIRFLLQGSEELDEWIRVHLSDFSVEDIEVGEPELEDVFIGLLPREQTVLETSLSQLSSPARASSSSEQASPIAVSAEGLTKRFGDFVAVDGVRFQIKRGEIFGLLGANGAGKTTVIKMLTGLLKPSSGRGEVAGVDMSSPGSAVKQRIGYMSQAFSLYQDLTVLENINLYSAIYSLGRERTKKRAEWVLGMAGLGKVGDTLAGSLPMGMRQRLALGCALVHQPEVLFLDEPTSGVDPVGRRRFWDTLFHLSREEGVSILITTHYMAEAEQCDHLALMFAGRVVSDASPDELKSQVEAEAGQLLEISYPDTAEAFGVLRGAGYGQASLFGRQIRLLCLHPEVERAKLAQLLPGVKIERRPLSLEDVFIHRVTSLERALD